MRDFSFAWPVWGNSTTSARDQARLLHTDRPARRSPPPPLRAAGCWRTSCRRSAGGSRRSSPSGWRIYFKGGWGSGTGWVTHQSALLRKGPQRISLSVLTRWNPSHALRDGARSGASRPGCSPGRSPPPGAGSTKTRSSALSPRQAAATAEDDRAPRSLRLGIGTQAADLSPFSQDARETASWPGRGRGLPPSRQSGGTRYSVPAPLRPAFSASCWRISWRGRLLREPEPLRRARRRTGARSTRPSLRRRPRAGATPRARGRRAPGRSGSTVTSPSNASR